MLAHSSSTPNTLLKYDAISSQTPAHRQGSFRGGDVFLHLLSGHAGSSLRSLARSTGSILCSFSTPAGSFCRLLSRRADVLRGASSVLSNAPMPCISEAPYCSYDFASIPFGGTVSTLPLLTSSQFVLRAVPLLSVYDFIIAFCTSGEAPL